MEIQTAFGVKVDVVTGNELNEFGKGLARDVRRALKEERQNSYARPIRRSAFQDGPAGTTILNLGAPAVGRYWSINEICVGDATLIPVPNVYAYLGVGSAANPSRMDMVHYFGQIPAAENFSLRTLEVAPSQDVYVLIVGTTTAEVWASMRFADYPDAAITASAV